MKDMIKRWIIKLFRINTHERELKMLSAKYESLKEQYDIRTEIVESYKADIENIEVELNKLEEIYADPTATINKLNEEIDRVAHKSYAQGRKDAYAEMGIVALDARVNGNVICVDADNKIVEIVQVPSLGEVCEEDGIEISDLVDLLPPYNNDEDLDS